MSGSSEQTDWTYGLRDSEKGGLEARVGGWGLKNFFPHPNKLLIWAFPDNLVKMVEALDELCGRGGGRDGRGWDRLW